MGIVITGGPNPEVQKKKPLSNIFDIKPKTTIVYLALRVLFLLSTLSNENVLVRAKPQPCSKALRIMAALVVGGALASPNGLGNVMPHIFTLMSTVSMGE